MFTFYDYGPSQNGWKIRELLRRTGQPHRRVEIGIFRGEGQTADFLARSPTGQVPAITFEDGASVSESNAILALLAEGTPYLPADRVARGRTLQWLFFEQNALEPSVASLRYWTLTGKLAARHPAVIDAVRARARRALDVLERGLAGGRFLAGDFSIADIALYAYGHAAGDAGLSLDAYPRVAGWAERVRDHEGPLSPVIPYSVDPDSARELP
jgi:glutathione S-transferase